MDHIIGEKVIHKSFGEGIVISQYRATDGGERIIVRFSEDEKTFVFPKVFESILNACDPVLDKKIRDLLKPPQIPLPPPYRYRTVYAKSRADFLEKVFGHGDYHAYESTPGKCTWRFSDDIIVWMVAFGSDNFGYVNRVLPNGQIEEEYLGKEQKRIDRTHSDYRFPYRLAVSIEDNKFRILGLYYYDKANSVPRKAYFAPISPENAYKRIPQAFIPDPRNV